MLIITQENGIVCRILKLKLKILVLILTSFVEFCKKFIGQVYWYGTCIYPCTESKLNSKAKKYPEHYTEDRMPKYKDAIVKHYLCADCVGLN